MSLILPKLAIGASWNPDTFDRTGILSLCWSDPMVGPPPVGPLVRIGFKDTPVPVFDLRQTASLTAPRAFKRTGYGTKLRFDIEIVYETVAEDPGANPYGLGVYGREGDDNSLFSLASLMGNSSSGLTQPPFGLSPPYLFLTTTYQMQTEQWLPVELDPDDGSPPAIDLGPKTILRTMNLALITRQTYRRVTTQLIPTTYVRMGDPSRIATLGAPIGAGPYFGTVTFTSALDAIAQNFDAILVWFNNDNGIVGGPYRWERLVMTSIAGNRLSASVTAATPWPGIIGAPTTTTGVYKIQTLDSLLRTPFYGFKVYAGAPPPSGMLPNQNSTQLIGGLV
jgi:hypothetical protein